MSLKLDLERRARGFLDGLPAKQFRQVAVRLFDLLRDPEASDTSALKNSPYRRADVGEYRIVYRVEGDVLLVPLIGKRNDGDVYKRLGRMG
jgi:mRNA interferase RelE/StbE